MAFIPTKRFFYHGNGEIFSCLAIISNFALGQKIGETEGGRVVGIWKGLKIFKRNFELVNRQGDIIGGSAGSRKVGLCFYFVERVRFRLIR